MWFKISDVDLGQLLTRVPETREGGDNFFGLFDYVEELHVRHNYSAALWKGMSLLEACRRAAPERYEAIHKGTPFYWLGMAAFNAFDYETATFFFDAGASEDLRLGADPINSATPGLMYLMLESEPHEQAARPLVEQSKAAVERAIQQYNGCAGRPADSDLSLDHLRRCFLRRALTDRPKWRTAATALISFFLERNHRSLMMRLRIGHGTSEPMFLHLFKGCVLFESLLKATCPPNEQGNTLAVYLRNKHNELAILRDVVTKGPTLADVLRDVEGADGTIQAAVTLTARARNTLGHDLGWDADLTEAMYNRLAQMIGNSCLHVIACLYRE